MVFPNGENACKPNLLVWVPDLREGTYVCMYLGVRDINQPFHSYLSVDNTDV